MLWKNHPEKKETEVIKEEIIVPEKIEEEVKTDKIDLLIIELKKNQTEMLAAIKELHKPKIETRQEIINPAKSDEQVAAEMILIEKEKKK